MKAAFKWVLNTYGQTVISYNRGGQELGRGKAILRPMTQADWQYTAGVLGSYRTDRFLCLAQADLLLEQVGQGGWVIWGGERYEVLTVRPVWMGGQVTHLWMALRAAEERAV